MKRSDIEFAYHEIMKCIEHLEPNHYTIGIYKHSETGYLTPGIQGVTGKCTDMCSEVVKNIIVWNTDKQLTIKQLSKIVNIWHELDKSA